MSISKTKALSGTLSQILNLDDFSAFSQQYHTSTIASSVSV